MDKIKVGIVGLGRLGRVHAKNLAFSIAGELGLPIIYAGLGEKPEDLIVFDPDNFIDGILKTE